MLVTNYVTKMTLTIDLDINNSSHDVLWIWVEPKRYKQIPKSITVMGSALLWWETPIHTLTHAHTHTDTASTLTMTHTLSHKHSSNIQTETTVCVCLWCIWQAAMSAVFCSWPLISSINSLQLLSICPYPPLYFPPLPTNITLPSTAALATWLPVAMATTCWEISRAGTTLWQLRGRENR